MAEDQPPRPDPLAPLPKESSRTVTGDRAEAQDAVSFMLSDPGVQEARARGEAAETELGMELCAQLQPFQERHDQAVCDSDAARLTGICPGKHGRWGRSVCRPWGPRLLPLKG